MKEHGVRNATLMAVAPVESSSVVINSTNGIEMPMSLITVKESKAGSLIQVVPEYNKLKKEGTPDQVKAFEDQLFNKYLNMYSEGTPQSAQGQPAPAQQQQQATPVKVTSQEQFAKLPSGTTNCFLSS
jgi:hypothetical protein